MKKIAFLISMTLFAIMTNAQEKANVFMTFSDFVTSTPSKYYDFQFKQRSMGDVFMTGGITNYRIKKVKPSSETENLTKNVWGILFHDSVFVNSYPYSKLLGFNKVLGIGYYSYFIGEPARLKEEQINLGIIKEGEPQRGVCCNTSYVILQDGSIKWLTPELLKDLISDNSSLKKELESKNLKQENVHEMFNILFRYNMTKK